MMNRSSHFLSALGMLLLVSGCDDPEPKKSGLPMNPPAAWEGAGFETVFNGKDLTHWQKQPEPGIHGTGGNWGVTENGVLYGEQDPPGSGKGGLLLTKETFGEFELEISMKPDWGPCSGIFLRANERGEGWQIYVDHHKNGNVGHVRLETKAYSVPFRPYAFFRVDEEKPAPLRVQPDSRTNDWPEGVYEETCTGEEFLAAWNPDDWNAMRIRCTGKSDLPVIEIWVNDLKTCKFDASKTTHPGFDREEAKEVVEPVGHIGLQVHKGKGWPNGARVFWKDIRIRRLD
ncbi:MAG: DUF1080 domain-containing protein [Verrucomicrobiales bacterium]|nr:DUF1080 domain-containing protein [Verrucomicrobiales bacterium]